MGDFFSTIQLGSFIQSDGFSGVVVLLLLILGVGGLVAGWLAKGYASYSHLDKSAKEIMIPQKELPLTIALQVFEGDRFGFFGEKLLSLLRQNFGSLFSSKGARILISTIADTQADGLKEANGLRIWGKVQGRALEVSVSERTIDSELSVFECFDFPLLKLQSLNPHLPGLQKEILVGALYGCLLRGQAFERGRFAVKKINSLVRQFEAVLPGIRLTQPGLFEELCVVCAWCHLFIGLQTKKTAPLQKALSLYQTIETFEWRKRELQEWAGIKANEASAAIALSMFANPTGALSNQAIVAADASQDYFEAERFPHQWGRLVTIKAFAQSVLAGTIEPGDVDLNSGQQALEQDLEQAIAYWRKFGKKRALLLAYYAKSQLAVPQAKRCSGVQDWQQAEHALLCAIEQYRPFNNWLGLGLDDLYFELAQLYLSQGVQFGDRACLQAAVQYFSRLVDKKVRSSMDQQDVCFALAQSYFQLGAITNEKQALAKALHLLNDIKDRGGSKDIGSDLDCFISVSRARLALLDRDQVQAYQAISGISALLGTTKTNSDKSACFTFEDLLALRVRLREMVFIVQGNVCVLEKAVSDQRILVQKKQEAGQDLEWAVQVGRLVELSMLCPERLIEHPFQFHQIRSALEQSLAVCKQKGMHKGQKNHQQISYIEGSLRLKQGRLLAAYGRVRSDLAVFNEALAAYESFLDCSGDCQGQELAEVLHELGQVLMDRSEHHGQHEGLDKALTCFAKAYELYLQAGLETRASCARRFMDNAQAAKLVYLESSSVLGLVHLVR